MINPFALLFTPRSAWKHLAEHMPTSIVGALIFPLIMAALPAVAWYVGTTQIGWSIGSGSPVRLTPASAQRILGLFYLAMVLSIVGIGLMVHWMSQTYGALSSPAKGIALAGFTATPLFLAGAVGFHPQFLLDLIVGLAAVSYAVYLLYVGVPAVMKIPEERGFLFASAVVAVCMVILIIIMGGSVILWDMGAAPTFID